MTGIDVTGLSIAAAARALRAGEYSPLELTEAYLRRIEALNPRVNAYITVTAERALDDARRATTEFAAGKIRGPLHGIPIAHKDLFETAGIRTTAGSKIHADNVPAADATVVRKLREAGSVLLGKLNMHEYAYGVSNDNPHYGAARNPWDPQRIPAGSSGGSGVAVAAALATATTGSDTGGSIRLPASLCGVVGLKPTFGRVSKAGLMPLSASLDHAGPLTRTVEDAALMLNAMAGYDAHDATSVRTAVDDALAGFGKGVRGLRIGVPRDYFFDHLQDDVAAAIEQAIVELRQLGAQVQDVAIAGIAEQVGATFGLSLAEAQRIHAESLRQRPQDFGADVRELLQSYTLSSAEIMAGLQAAAQLTASMQQALEAVEVLLTPTAPVTAVPIGTHSVRYGGIEESLLAAMIRCTAPFNVSRLPALSLPCGFSREGLPIGLQLAGRPFDEATVLRVGHAYEQATGWQLRTPTV